MTKGIRSVFGRRHLFPLIVASLPLAAAGPGLAAEPNWPKEPYRYLVIDQDLRDVIGEFGRNVRLPVRISDAVTGRRVRNEFTISEPRQFLQRLCDSYGLVWYFDGAVLHINDETEVRTEPLAIRGFEARSVLNKLEALGVADPRFQIRVGGGGGVINISGPPPYLTMVRKTVEAMERSVAPRPIQEVTNGDSLKVRVFRGTREGS